MVDVFSYVMAGTRTKQGVDFQEEIRGIDVWKNLPEERVSS